MKTTNTQWLSLAGFAVAALGFIAWKNSDPVQSVSHYFPAYGQQNADTIPLRKKPADRYNRNDYRLDDVDVTLRDLDRILAGFDKNLKIDLGRMDQELKAAMNEIKNIDFDKINAEVKASLKDADWPGTQAEIKRALREVEAGLSETDTKNIHKEVEEALESTRSWVNGDLIRKSVALGLEAAKTGIQKVKKELQLWKEFTDGLQKDGLIDKKEGFRIRIKDHEMYINGKKQSKEVNDKYRKYFKDGEYTIRSDRDEEPEVI